MNRDGLVADLARLAAADPSTVATILARLDYLGLLHIDKLAVTERAPICPCGRTVRGADATPSLIPVYCGLHRRNAVIVVLPAAAPSAELIPDCASYDERCDCACGCHAPPQRTP